MNTDERRADCLRECGFVFLSQKTRITIARAIRADDEAARMVLAPMDDLKNIIALLEHSMMFRPYVEYSPGPLSEPWATKVLRDGKAMLAAGSAVIVLHNASK